MLKPAAALSKDKLGASHPATLQHRHFAVIAGILAGIGEVLGDDLAHHREICDHFADELAKTNPKFDRARFLRACGYA